MLIEIGKIFVAVNISVLLMTIRIVDNVCDTEHRLQATDSCTGDI